jgi:hypothetical protein
VDERGLPGTVTVVHWSHSEALGRPMATSYGKAHMNLRQAFLGPGPTTRMAGPPEAMAQEGAFIDAMKQVRSYRLSGSSLTLGDANGLVLRFEAAAPP